MGYTVSSNNMGRKIISFCLWAAIWHGEKLTHLSFTFCSESSILTQQLYCALSGKQSSKIPSHPYPLQNQVNGDFFLAFVASPTLQVSRVVIMYLLVCTVMLYVIWGQWLCVFFILVTSTSSKWKKWFNIFLSTKKNIKFC